MPRQNGNESSGVLVSSKNVNCDVFVEFQLKKMVTGYWLFKISITFKQQIKIFYQYEVENSIEARISMKGTEVYFYFSAKCLERMIIVSKCYIILYKVIIIITMVYSVFS